MRLVLIVAFVLSASIAGANERSADTEKQVIRCSAKGKPNITMTLNAERKLNRVVSCIAGEFAGDMTPCAPNGGYGLSYPTGAASLARIVDRWQDYGDHTGGITGYSANASRIQFDGGFFSPNGGSGGDGWSEQWTFIVDRLTGEGKLTEDGKPDAVYACAKANPKF
jgi:hypothetical protein